MDFSLVLRWKCGLAPIAIHKAKEQIYERMNWRFWRYNGRSKLTSEVPRFEYG